MDSLTSIDLHNTDVTDLPEYLFARCAKLTNIRLPVGLKSIAANCFQYCTNLRNISFPMNFTSLSEYSFYESGVYEIVFNNLENQDFTIIPDRAFFCAQSLTIIHIPSYITSIGAYAFSQTNISYIDLPESVKNILTSCFEGCKELRSITLPENLEIVGDQFVSNCPSLESINSTSPNFIVEGGALFNSDRSEIIAFPVASQTKYFYIPEKVTKILPCAFYGATNLIYVLIPEGEITEIGYRSFANCTKLTTISLPSSITIVGEEAFLGCISLKCNVIVNDPILKEKLISSASMQESMFEKCMAYRTLKCDCGVFSGSLLALVCILL